MAGSWASRPAAGRENFATEFIQQQVRQKLLGHAKITTTMQYVHMDEQMMS